MGNQQQYKEKTVTIDWGHKTISYVAPANKVVHVHIVRGSGSNKTDMFQLLCVVSLIQRLYTGEDGVTLRSHFDDALWGRIMQGLGWTCARTALTTYWSRVRNADATYVKVDVDNMDINEEERKGYTRNLFGVENGNPFLGQRERLSDGTYRLWQVEFVEQEHEEDPKLSRLQQLVEELGSTSGANLLPKARRTHVEVVRGVEDTPYAMKAVLPQTEKTLLIVGSNLHRIVEDEIEAEKQGRQEYCGQHRRYLREWLSAVEDRKAAMLLCDPRSHAAVLHYAIVFGAHYIDDLCKAILRYQEWQKEMGSKGLDVRVASAVPVSLMVADGDAEDAEKSLMLVTPMAFECRPELRPTFVVKRSAAGEVFKIYYSFFRDQHRRATSVMGISQEDLRACAALEDVLKQHSNGLVSYKLALGNHDQHL